MSLPRISALTFDELAHRLVRDLAKLVRSGTVSERRLAVMVGLSQSHLHNVVNGLRTLTSTVADQVLDRLEWSLLDLIESTEVQVLLNRRQASLGHGCEIPLSRGCVGPEFRLLDDKYSEIFVPNSWLARAEKPVAVSAGDDPEMDPVIIEGDILLIDQSPRERLQIYADALYVVQWRGHSVARWLRFAAKGVYLITAENWTEPARWTPVVRPASRQFDIIEGKIIAIARPPDSTFRQPVPPSASS